MKLATYSLVLLAVAGFAQDNPHIRRMEPSVHFATPAPRDDSQADAIRHMRPASRRFALKGLTSREITAASRKPGLSAVGVARALPGDILSHGEWSTAADGTRVWRLVVQSSGAEGVRLHFADFHVGDGKVFLLAGDQTVGPYSDSGIFKDGDFWTDLVTADSVTVAYTPAAGAAGDDVPFRITELSHRFQAAEKATKSAAAADRTPLAAAAPCNQDVTCYPDYKAAASAVALMQFESDGSSYECTGSLIASSAQPAVPYFLTANHCISTDTEARSLVTFFNYQTSTCNGSVPSLSGSPHVTGANYVMSRPMANGDFSLLKLTGFPNTDVTVLGWLGTDIAADQNVAGISHPVGDYKRIAFGQRTADVTIRFTGGETMPASVGYQVDWFQGTTQSGSSGSPLIATIDSKQYLVGTLSGGPNVNDNNTAQVCAVRNLNASYGRFSAAYKYLADTLGSTDGTTTPTTPQQTTFTANPNPITLTAGQTYGKTTLTWSTSAAATQIRVGSPTGVAFTGINGSTGSADTGEWVNDGLVFYLQDATDGNSSGASKTLATVTVRVISPSDNNPGPGSATLTASPNPVRAGRSGTGRTTLTWNASVSRVQIRAESPTGPTVTDFAPPNGSITVSRVPNGTTFYLQDASSGRSSGASRTLASVTIHVVTN